MVKEKHKMIRFFVQFDKSKRPLSSVFEYLNPFQF